MERIGDLLRDLSACGALSSTQMAMVSRIIGLVAWLVTSSVTRVLHENMPGMLLLPDARPAHKVVEHIAR